MPCVTSDRYSLYVFNYVWILLQFLDCNSLALLQLSHDFHDVELEVLLLSGCVCICACDVLCPDKH